MRSESQLRPAAWVALVALVLLAYTAPSVVSFPFVAASAVLSVPVLGPTVLVVTIAAAVVRMRKHPAPARRMAVAR